MYGSGPGIGLGGGIATGALAYTGADMTWPLIGMTVAVTVGALLIVRERLVRRRDAR